MYYDVETMVSLAGKPSIFTYFSDKTLKRLQLIAVPFGKKLIPGMILGESKQKPKFATKTIIELNEEILIGENFLNFAEWFKAYYALKSDEMTGLFLPPFLLTKARTGATVTKTSTAAVSQPELNTEQSLAVDEIKNSNKPVILEGVVGSGKTRVYFEAAKASLKLGRSVLILSPEIPLSEHLYQRASEFFGSDNIIHYHSEMTSAKRRSIWKKIAVSPVPVVVIGPRSALFLPVDNYGLICVDEFQENAYKQLDGVHYHANDAAGALAKIHGSKIVYGSATPPIREYYYSVVKKYTKIVMDELATGKKTDRQIEIVDQKDRKDFAKNPFLSNKVIQSIEDSLSKKQQVMILHNRRGSARVIICSNCAWTLQCVRCDSNLVYHQDSNKCLCHTCGYRAALPSSCPSCGNIEILLRSMGTKSLADEVQRLFGSSIVARFDSDNSKLENLSARLKEVEEGRIDILVGTQLLAKGLDLPKLGLVVITSSDSLLQLPDFASSEKLYQLIAQASGRVGRGHSNGKCIIQTYQPNHPAFLSLKNSNWKAFYDLELIERQEHSYPPFVFLLKLLMRRKTEAGADRAAANLAELLRAKSGITVFGPAPSLIGRENNQFVRQIIVKSKDRARLLQITRELPSGWTADLDPTSLV